MVFVDKLICNYATALFKVSSSNPDISRQLGSLKVIIFKIQEKYNESVLMHSYSYKAILSCIEAQNFSPVIINLITKILRKKRIKILPKVFEYFEELKLSAKDTIIAQISSALPLNQNEQNELSSYLSLRFNKKFEIQNNCNRSLIGGVKVEFDGFLLDSSVKHKLQELKKYINT